MFKLSLLSSLLIPGVMWSQTTPIPAPAPDPPACLSKAVTQGSVTLSCTLLDTTQVNGASAPGTPELVGFPIFQVRLSSTDPDVVGFRVGVTLVDASVVVNGLPASLTTWGTVGKSPAVSVTAPPEPYFRYTFRLSSSNINGIEVQELKASGSQKF